VKDLFDRYGLHYHTAPLPRQFYSAWHKVVRLSLPNGWLEKTTARNLPEQLGVLYKLATGSPRERRALQRQLEAEAA
jgi:linoleoyl-CoA desaturase